MTYARNIKLIPFNCRILPSYCSWFNNPNCRTNLFPETSRKKCDISNWLNTVITTKSFNYYSIYLNSKNIGHCGLKIKKRYAEISIYLFNKKYRGRGVGSYCLEYLLKKCVHYCVSQFVVVILSNNFESVRFFTKKGFKYSASKGTKLIYRKKVMDNEVTKW